MDTALVTSRIIIAITKGREDDLVAFIASGADVSAAHNQSGWTPLHHACSSSGGSVGIVRILIQAGADVNKLFQLYPDDAGLVATPLSLAVNHRKFEIVKLLLAAGAGPKCELSYQIAVMDGHRHILPLLLQHGVPMYVPEDFPRDRSATWAYHDKVVAAGGYDTLVKKHRKILASVVDKVVVAKFRRRAPKEVCAHVALFIAPPGGF